MLNNCDEQVTGRGFTAINGDSAVVLKDMPSSSIDLCVYSPPFLSLFTYSAFNADLGNCSDDREFFEQYGFIVRELARVMKPGRTVAVHCSDLPTRKWKDGYLGLSPFSDRIREAHEHAGFIFYRRVTIWKCPVVEQGRTHARNLAYGELMKDSAMSAPGLPDYLMVFHAPGDNQNPIRHTKESFPLSQWQEWASPVWMTIDQTDVLGGLAAQRAAREQQDERHVCPLQLDVIRRAVIMWSNPGETVLSPFMGIGSEGYVSLKERRRFVGVELKKAYWRQAVKHLQSVEAAPALPMICAAE